MEKQVYTLNEIEARRTALDAEIKRKKQTISRRFSLLTASAPATTNKVTQLMTYAERAYLMYDGVMTGYKLFSRLRNLLPGGRRRR